MGRRKTVTENGGVPCSALASMVSTGSTYEHHQRLQPSTHDACMCVSARCVHPPYRRLSAETHRCQRSLHVWQNFEATTSCDFGDVTREKNPKACHMPSHGEGDGNCISGHGLIATPCRYDAEEDGGRASRGWGSTAAESEGEGAHSAHIHMVQHVGLAQDNKQTHTHVHTQGSKQQRQKDHNSLRCGHVHVKQERAQIVRSQFTTAIPQGHCTPRQHSSTTAIQQTDATGAQVGRGAKGERGAPVCTPGQVRHWVGWHPWRTRPGSGQRWVQHQRSRTPSPSPHLTHRPWTLRPGGQWVHQ